MDEYTTLLQKAHAQQCRWVPGSMATELCNLVADEAELPQEILEELYNALVAQDTMKLEVRVGICVGYALGYHAAIG